jgi:hypothetical protein
VTNGSVGIESPSGTDGLEVAYHTSYIEDSLAVVFSRFGDWLHLSQSSGSLGSGESDTLLCTLTSLDLDTGVYHSTLVISSNDPDSVDNPWLVPVSLTVSGGTFSYLSLTPESLFFEAVSGGLSPSSQSMSVTETGGGTVSFTAVWSCSWLTLAPVSGSTPLLLTAGIALGDLEPGLYYDTVLVSSGEVINSPRSSEVLLAVYLCGDANNDGIGPNIADLTYLVDYLFRDGSPPAHPSVADVDGDGADLSVADLTYLVDYLFGQGPSPQCR